MASSGSFLTNGWYSSSKGDYVYLEFAWSVYSTSVADNSTTIYWELRGKRTASGYINAGGFKVVIDGTAVYSKSTDYRIELYNGTVVASGTYTLYHDGTGKRTFGASAEGGIYAYAVNCTGSGSWELPTIPRQATLTSAQDFTDEQNPTIGYSNPAGDAVDALEACISIDSTQDDIKYRAIPKKGNSYTFTLTDEERKVLQNATATYNARTVFFYVRTTISGVVYHSSIPKMLTIVNANPTFSNDQVDYLDTNNTTTAITENPKHIVQNQSHLTASFTDATATKCAWITKYVISVNGLSVETTSSGSVEFAAINSADDVLLTVTAHDSRGNTVTVSKNVTMLAWSSPVLNATVERLNNYEDETYLTVNASVSSINGKNTMDVRYQYKTVDGSYGEAIPIDSGVRKTITCDKNKAYIFRIFVADRFSNTTKEIRLDKGIFPLFIDTEKNSVGINCFPQGNETLEVSGFEFVSSSMCWRGTADTNANNVVGQGVWHVPEDYNSTNYPTSGGNGLMFVIGTSFGITYQIFALYSGETWCRMQWYYNWKEWKPMTL